MIPNELVQSIKDTARIEHIIAESITLKHSGPNFIGKCPFHEEVTESFTVSPSKGIYKCFGCGKGGDAVHFVQEYERVSYPLALKLVAKRYNIDVPERELSESELAAFKKREASLLFLNKQNDSFVSTLSNNQQAIDWLTVERGILPA